MSSPFDAERQRIILEGSQEVFSQVKKYYRGNWIIDVGSNTGEFIDCALHCFPEASILAFEPVKPYFDFAVERFRNKRNVFIENHGLSDRDEETTIFVAKHNIGWNTMVQEKVDGDNKSNRQKVSCFSFDHYLDFTGLDIKIDVVKIDTEGFEYKVLKGMKRFLRDQKPAIICEIGWGVGHPHWKEELEAFEYLYSIGYDRSNENAVRELKATTDILFTVV